MIAGTQIADAKAVNVVELVAQDVTLHRASGSEWQGPCPACGGSDRLHVKQDGWFCRQCQPIDPRHGWHTAIDWVMWRRGLTFREAVAQLTGQPLEGTMHTTQTRKFTEDYSPTRKLPQTAEWRTRAASLMTDARHTLFTGPDPRGRQYLEARGLRSDVWMHFSLGYTQHYNPDSRREEPCIVLPWQARVGIVAVRFRFIAPPGKTKIVSLKGSEFTGVLFGAQGLLKCAEDCRTLVLCEGEINALSIWQVAHETNLDVLSLGSESAKLAPAMVDYACKFMRVIVWMDRAEVARELMAQIPGAYGLPSVEGKDANDRLKEGTLGELLTLARFKAACDEEEQRKLLYDVWDMANHPLGVDSGTARGFKWLCDKLGREFDLVEIEPDRWVTQRWLQPQK